MVETNSGLPVMEAECSECREKCGVIAPFRACGFLAACSAECVEKIEARAPRESEE